jgi:predicted RNA-binding protein with TRAM domain
LFDEGSARIMSISSPKPVELGKEYTVDIIGTGKTGDGIARVQNFVIFVKNAKAGDKNVRIKINSIGNRFAIADVV